MKKKKLIYIETLILSIVLAILIIPGMYLVNMIAHEYYHVSQHKDYAEQICIDLGEDSSLAAHTLVTFPNNTIEGYTEEMREQEEKTANRVGRGAAVAYLVIFVIVAVWLISLMKRHEDI